jgi:PAS domain S-box-containing protein
MDLVYPPDAPLVLNQWNKLSQGIPVTFEMRWKGTNYRESEDGDGIEDAQWVLSACVPILDPEGNLISIAGNTIDINAQKRVQEQALQRAEALEQARASERKFSQFAQLAPIAIFALNAEGEMTYCNQRFFELTGHAPVQDYKSVDWEAHIVFPDDYRKFERLWKTLLEDKEASHAHVRLKKTWDLGDGVARQTWVESQASPELDSNGNVVSIFGTLSDISRFKWAEEIQRTRIEEALEAKRKQEK